RFRTYVSKRNPARGPSGEGDTSSRATRVAGRGCATQANADRAGDSVAGAGSGGSKRLGFLVSAGQRSPGSCVSQQEQERGSGNCERADAPGAGAQTSQVPGAGGRSSLRGGNRARRAPSSAGRSGSRKPAHQCAREKQCHSSGCELGRDLFGVQRSSIGKCSGQYRRPRADVAANGAECDRLGATGLSFAGTADEGAGRGQLTGAHLARRHYSGTTDSEWPQHSGGSGSRGCEAVAFQAIPAKRAARGNAGAHHGELHDFDQLGGRLEFSASHITLRKIKRASGFLRIQDARAALPQNCSIGNVRLNGKSGNGTRVPNSSHQSASLQIADYRAVLRCSRRTSL